MASAHANSSSAPAAASSGSAAPSLAPLPHAGAALSTSPAAHTAGARNLSMSSSAVGAAHNMNSSAPVHAKWTPHSQTRPGAPSAVPASALHTHTHTMTSAHPPRVSMAASAAPPNGGGRVVSNAASAAGVGASRPSSAQAVDPRASLSQQVIFPINSLASGVSIMQQTRTAQQLLPTFTSLTTSHAVRDILAEQASTSVALARMVEQLKRAAVAVTQKVIAKPLGRPASGANAQSAARRPPTAVIASVTAAGALSSAAAGAAGVTEFHAYYGMACARAHRFATVEFAAAAFHWRHASCWWNTLPEEGAAAGTVPHACHTKLSAAPLSTPPARSVTASDTEATEVTSDADSQVAAAAKLPHVRSDGTPSSAAPAHAAPTAHAAARVGDLRMPLSTIQLPVAIYCPRAGGATPAGSARDVLLKPYHVYYNVQPVLDARAVPGAHGAPLPTLLHFNAQYLQHVWVPEHLLLWHVALQHAAERRTLSQPLLPLCAPTSSDLTATVQSQVCACVSWARTEARIPPDAALQSAMTEVSSPAAGMSVHRSILAALLPALLNKLPYLQGVLHRLVLPGGIFPRFAQRYKKQYTGMEDVHYCDVAGAASPAPSTPAVLGTGVAGDLHLLDAHTLANLDTLLNLEALCERFAVGGGTLLRVSTHIHEYMRKAANGLSSAEALTIVNPLQYEEATTFPMLFRSDAMYARVAVHESGAAEVQRWLIPPTTARALKASTTAAAPPDDAPASQKSDAAAPLTDAGAALVPSAEASAGGASVGGGAAASPATATPLQTRNMPSRFMVSCPTEPQPLRVRIMPEVTVISTMHSHLARTEIIGLLAGRVCEDDPEQPGRPLLIVSHAIPCRAMPIADDQRVNVEIDASSSACVHDLIHAIGCQVVGWYHSHPDFQPDPSVRDIQNQEMGQASYRTTTTTAAAAASSPAEAPGGAHACNADGEHAHAAPPAAAAASIDAYIGMIVSPWDKKAVGALPNISYFRVVNQNVFNSREDKSTPVPVPVQLVVHHDQYMAVEVATHRDDDSTHARPSSIPLTPAAATFEHAWLHAVNWVAHLHRRAHANLLALFAHKPSDATGSAPWVFKYERLRNVLRASAGGASALTFTLHPPLQKRRQHALAAGVGGKSVDAMTPLPAVLDNELRTVDVSMTPAAAAAATAAADATTAGAPPATPPLAKHSPPPSTAPSSTPTADGGARTAAEPVPGPPQAKRARVEMPESGGGVTSSLTITTPPDTPPTSQASAPPHAAASSEPAPLNATTPLNSNAAKQQPARSAMPKRTTPALSAPSLHVSLNRDEPTIGLKPDMGAEFEIVSAAIARYQIASAMLRLAGPQLSFTVGLIVDMLEYYSCFQQQLSMVEVYSTMHCHIQKGAPMLDKTAILRLHKLEIAIQMLGSLLPLPQPAFEQLCTGIRCLILAGQIRN